MEIRSLGLRSELMVWATRGHIIKRPTYWVVKTPSDPGYYFGNLLLLAEPPTGDDLALWQARFVEEFPSQDILHTTLWWDQGAVTAEAHRALQLAGFRLENTNVLSMRSAIVNHVVAVQSDLQIGPLTVEQAPLLARLAAGLADRSDETYLQFLQRRATWQQLLMHQGIAQFFGAFDISAGTDAATLVASLGVITDRHLARFQDVQTASAFRRRGLATALLQMAARWCWQRQVSQLVIVAEPSSEAERLYRSIGFQNVETTSSAYKYPTIPNPGA